jgi:hypothetical protein
VQQCAATKNVFSLPRPACIKPYVVQQRTGSKTGKLADYLFPYMELQQKLNLTGLKWLMHNG